MAALLGLPTAAVADPQLSFPLACTLSQNCFVLSYVDTEMSTTAKDFACGPLSFDGNTATNIRLKSFAAMESGVDVLASAPGTVLRVLDGVPDTGSNSSAAPTTPGNALLIDHGDGWMTGYGHLKSGSIAVVPGQKVLSGQRLGSVGLSGGINFPFLSFEVRHDGKPVDPFTGLPVLAGCGVKGHSLWKTDIAYVPAGLTGVGFALGRPTADEARHGAYDQTALTTLSPGLAFWAEVLGLQTGDRVELRLTGPDGGLMAEAKLLLDRPHADLFAFAGAKRPQGGWKSGSYRGTVQIVRGDQILVDQTRQIALP